MPVAKEIMESKELKASRKNYEQSMYQFVKDEDLTLRQLETEPIRKVLRALLVVHTNALTYCGVRILFFHFFYERDVPVTLLSGARFLQLVLEDSQTRGHLPY